MEHIQSTTLDMDELMLNYDEAVADDHNLYAFFSVGCIMKLNS